MHQLSCSSILHVNNYAIVQSNTDLACGRSKELLFLLQVLSFGRQGLLLCVLLTPQVAGWRRIRNHAVTLMSLKKLKPNCSHDTHGKSSQWLKETKTSLFKNYMLFENSLICIYSQMFTNEEEKFHKPASCSFKLSFKIFYFHPTQRLCTLILKYNTSFLVKQSTNQISVHLSMITIIRLITNGLQLRVCVVPRYQNDFINPGGNS